MKLRYLLIISILISSLGANADVTLDGTLGRSDTLPGPNYLIGADLGQQRGGNLFHSFQDFNLNRFESATFSGPNSINNVINRVTGGNPSNIDGLIRSVIPNADMYFINPNGILFGPNAQLDVQGSFHASTADYLRLRDGGLFDARNPSDSILTVAPSESFGFLNSFVAPISVQGRGEVSQGLETGLSVPEGQTLSLIGGKIDIRAGTFFRTVTVDDEGNGSTEIIRLPIFSAPYGRINLASVASTGEVKLGKDFVDVSSFNKLADIHFTEKSLIATTGKGGGSIFIRSGQFFADDSAIEAKTLGSKDGGVIDIRANVISLTNGATLGSNTEGSGKGTDTFLHATDSIMVFGENSEGNTSGIYANFGIPQKNTDKTLGDVGQISLTGKTILFKDGAYIFADTYGGGKGGNVTFHADSVTFTRENDKKTPIISIRTYSQDEGAGDGGTLLIEANNISFTGGSQINANTSGKGNGGSVTFKASNTVAFEGKPSSGIYLDTMYKAEGAGDGGTLLIEANNISFTGGSQIDASTSGKGNGGSVTFKASNTVAFEGKPSSGIYLHTMYEAEGDGGTLLIEANNISFTGGSKIDASTSGTGNAGTVTLHVNNLLQLTGVDEVGNASRIFVTADVGTGNAGNIFVKAQDVLLNDGAYLISTSFNSGKAGNIHVHATGTITIAGADKKGWRSMIAAGSNPKSKSIIGGKGGNITIEADQLIIKYGGSISASSIAPKGIQSSKGGNITISVQGAVKLSGVNPYGENEDGFGSGIYTRSTGDNASDAGTIMLQAGSLMIRDGALIMSNTNNNAQGGNIDIDVRGTVTITGDASNIQLRGPADSQIEYLQGFSPSKYNQSTSGIYARSEGKNDQAGQGGNITLSAQNLTLTNQGKISTSSAGGGKAGNIIIKVAQLQLDSSASIASESRLSNAYDFANIAERDSHIVISGDIVKVADIGNGKLGRYINTGENLLKTTPVYTVANITALQQLSNQYSLTKGNMVEVQDIGNGQSARFIYAENFQHGLSKWIKVDDKVTVTFENMAELNKIQRWYSPDEDIPYRFGEVIKVTEAGNGKPATFIYATLFDQADGYTEGQALRVNQFTVTDAAALNKLSKTTFVQVGDNANIIDTSSRFVFNGQSWSKLNNNPHTVHIKHQNHKILTENHKIS